jgi:D-alanyl-D-alanine dipeptidase
VADRLVAAQTLLPGGIRLLVVEGYRRTAVLGASAHATGAAVDLTLCTLDGTELWMGTPVQSARTALSHTGSGGVGREARHGRCLLTRVLETVGLVNYPAEWWHWSFGDCYWAQLTGARQARYGPLHGRPD